MPRLSGPTRPETSRPVSSTRGLGGFCRSSRFGWVSTRVPSRLRIGVEPGPSGRAKLLLSREPGDTLSGRCGSAGASPSRREANPKIKPFGALEQIQNLSSVRTDRNVCATHQWGRHSCLPFLQTNSESALGGPGDEGAHRIVECSGRDAKASKRSQCLAPASGHSHSRLDKPGLIWENCLVRQRHCSESVSPSLRAAGVSLSRPPPAISRVP